MTPSRVVSAAPTMAIDFGFMAGNLSRLIEAVIATRGLDPRGSNLGLAETPFR